jgi:hypothetical protein
VIEDRVLRPAMVMVAKGGAKPPKSAEDAAPQASPPNESSDEGN